MITIKDTYIDQIENLITEICIYFKEITPINMILKTTKDMLSDKLVKTAVKMMTTQRKRK